MGRFCRVLGPYLWCCLCVCALLLVHNFAQAATRKNVSLPSASSHINNSSGPTTRNGPSINVPGPLIGEYIEGTNPKSRVKIDLTPKADFSIPNTFKHVKNSLKGGVAGFIGGIVVGELLGGIGGLIDESGQPVKNGFAPTTSTDVFWCNSSASTYCDGSTIMRSKFKTPKAYHDAFVSTQPPHYNYCDYKIVPIDANRVTLYSYYRYDTPNCIYDFNTTLVKHGSCIAPSVYDAEQKQCVTPTLVPLTDADYNDMEQWLNQQPPEWIKDLLKEACNGSLAPQRCFDDLYERSKLDGPLNVAGPSKTTSTTSTGPDGVTDQTTVTERTSYDVSYGPDYFDWKQKTDKETKKNGTVTDTETQTESDDVTDTLPAEKTPNDTDTDPEEKPEEEPKPCTSNCDGPEYEDQYEPTDTTKEDVIDSYADRVQSIPIIAAVTGLFDVSVYGECPVWQVNEELQILSASMPINLVFDHLCLPWFVALGPFIKAVMLAVCAFAAVRIALL